MTNETVANIAVTVTAAMLATAAVAFTLSGNAPADPAAGDLPVISVQAATSSTSTSPTMPPVLQPESPVVVAEAPASGGSSAPRSTGSATTKPKTGTTSTAKGGTTTAISGTAAAATVSGDGATSNGSTRDHQNSEHEVIRPQVHETDEHGHHSQDPQIEED